jgi:hypothetical protein
MDDGGGSIQEWYRKPRCRIPVGRNTFNPIILKLVNGDSRKEYRKPQIGFLYELCH